MLAIPSSLYDQLRREAEVAYPNEGCGVLLGHSQDLQRTVTRVIPVTNIAGSPRSRYAIDPAELIPILATLRKPFAGAILGFYHSHPNHPALWSQTDLAEAHWLGSSYVITEVIGGTAAETKSFLLQGDSEEEKHFAEEELRIVDESAGIHS